MKNFYLDECIPLRRGGPKVSIQQIEKTQRKLGDMIADIEEVRSFWTGRIPVQSRQYRELEKLRTKIYETALAFEELSANYNPNWHTYAYWIPDRSEA